MLRRYRTSQGVLQVLRSPLRYFASHPKFANVDPNILSSKCPHNISNFINGQWTHTAESVSIPDPLTGETFIRVPSTQLEEEIRPFIRNLRTVPKSGLHNPLKNPERYVLYGNINRRVASELHRSEVFRFFVRCIQRVMPKSEAQAAGEVEVVRKFFENFSGDNIRLLCRGFVQAGDHMGQQSIGYRWPYGPVVVISPYNFPLEIPIMQFMAAVMVGNRPLLKTENRVGLPVEQFIRLLLECGMPATDFDFINCRGPLLSQMLPYAAMTQFTGGGAAAQSVIEATGGKVKLEDSGFDWKILGPLVGNESEHQIDYVAWQCDQDAYAMSGQKCSAQSLLLPHSSWVAHHFLDKIQSLASRRNLAELTLSPILSHSNDDIRKHLDRILKVPGSKVLFGGKPLGEPHSIPLQYGAFQPTAVQVDIKAVLKDHEAFELVTQELFGPFQVVMTWDKECDLIEVLEKIDAHLSAAVVSTDREFVNRILGATVNGTTYAGIRARTTGAPQNHWFGPAGNPLAAGIGTPEAILSTWTCHREIILDEGPLPIGWSSKIPAPT